MCLFYLIIFIQVVLESLPVSSSGHLLLAQQMFHFMEQGAADRMLALLDAQWSHLLHLPVLFIVACFFIPQYWWAIGKVRRTWPIIMRVGLLTVLADCVTAFFFFYFQIYPVTWWPLSLGFATTATLLLSLCWCPVEKPSVALTASRALLLGLVQGFALLPGISRLGSVYVAARWLGFVPRRAFEISWLLHVPLMAAASMRAFYKMYRYGVLLPDCLLFPTALMLLGATVVSALCFYVTYRLAISRRLWIFGIYMILPLVFALILAQ